MDSDKTLKYACYLLAEESINQKNYVRFFRWLEANNWNGADHKNNAVGGTNHTGKPSLPVFNLLFVQSDPNHFHTWMKENYWVRCNSNKSMISWFSLTITYRISNSKYPFCCCFCCCFCCSDFPTCANLLVSERKRVLRWCDAQGTTYRYLVLQLHE